MLLKFVIASAICAISLAKDDQKWVWGDNNRDESRGRLNFDGEGRYEVYENGRPFRPSGSYYERPYERPELNNINRPGGVYGGTSSGNYGQGHPLGPGNYGHGHLHPQYPTDTHNPEILTGPVPSWVKEGPFKNYDKCKCTEKFNCQSPGISYGHCDVGKQYCCYASKKLDQVGGPLPSRPVHSIENGILVGPGGPVDGSRPGSFRPGRPGGFGLGTPGRGDYRPGPINHRPVHSPENGILVGPGGPFDRPLSGRPGGGYGSYGFGRSGKDQ